MLPSPPFPYINSCIDTSQMNFCRKKKLYLIIVLFLREQHFIYQNHYIPWSSLQVNIFFVKCKSNFRNVNPRDHTAMIRPISAEVRLEMETTVRFPATRFRACRTAFYVSASRFAVISSSSKRAGSAAAARAMESSCHCPCENSSGVHTVS